MKRHIRTSLAIAALAACCSPASASVIYDFQFSLFGFVTGELKFSESSLVTSLTPVTSFLVNTITTFGSPLDSFSFNPTTSGGLCGGVRGVSPACYLTHYIGGGAIAVGGLPDYSALGTHTIFGATVTITETPEPATLALLGLGLAGLAATRRRKLN